MDSTGIKIMLVTLLMSGAVSAPACSVSFPPSYIDLEDEAYSPELDIHFHLCALARHYFPDCVVLTKNSAGTPPAASPPEPTEAEERLFEAGWEALKRNPEERFPAAWRKLLSLPEKERRSRTTQTLYLLGNLQAQENPREAYGWYQKLRAAVNRGLPDPRQLAAGSFRTNYFYAKDPVQRLRYLVLAAAFGSCPDAGTPEVSDGRPWNPCPFRQELWRELCAMIRQNPHRFLRDPLTAEVAVLFRPELIRHVSGPFVCGERLAMRAFQRGAFVPSPPEGTAGGGALHLLHSRRAQFFLFPRVAGNFLAGILPERFAVRQGDRGRGQGGGRCDALPQTSLSGGIVQFSPGKCLERCRAGRRRTPRCHRVA